jgi:prolyl-tRNA editing enzyme YbaK/EbsC (Cys-tRNA(Pro) deacylase)
LHPRVREVLQASQEAFTVHRRDAGDAPPGGVPAAETVLVCGGDGGPFCLVSIPASRRLALDAVARTLGLERARPATAEELRAETGHPPCSVSPLGGNGHRVLVDVRLLAFPTVLVGGGEEGTEIELSPDSLVRLTGARTADVSSTRGMPRPTACGFPSRP